MLDFLKNAVGEPVVPSEEDLGRFRAALDQDHPDKADLYLFSTAAFLKDALIAGAALETVTSASVAATHAAIAACAAAAWITHDPEAARNEELLHRWLESSRAPGESFPYPLRPMHIDPEARKAEQEAYRAAIAWLDSEAVSEYPEIQNRSLLAQTLRRARGEPMTLYPTKAPV